MVNSEFLHQWFVTVGLAHAEGESTVGWAAERGLWDEMVEPNGVVEYLRIMEGKGATYLDPTEKE